MFKSFALTIRPREGINDQTVEECCKFAKKFSFSFGALEKTKDIQTRHLHLQIWSDEPKRKADIAKQLQRICERTIDNWDNAQLKVLRSGIKIAYSDWYLDYLVENDEKIETDEIGEIIINNPPEKSMDYYPTEDEQEALKNKINATDPRFHQMEVELKEFLKDDTDTLTMNKVASFLAHSMYVKRTMKVIIAKRDRISLCESLYNYASMSTDINNFKSIDKKHEIYCEQLKNHFNSLEIQE